MNIDNEGYIIIQSRKQNHSKKKELISLNDENSNFVEAKLEIESIEIPNNVNDTRAFIRESLSGTKCDFSSNTIKGTRKQCSKSEGQKNSKKHLNDVIKDDKKIYHIDDKLKFHKCNKINKIIRSRFKKTDLNSYSLNDSGNAKLFLDIYSGYIIYNVDIGNWFIWEGRYWEKDTSNEIFKCALITMIMYQKHSKKQNIDQSVINHSLKSGNSTPINNLLKIAQTMCVCNSSDFDRKKHLLNVNNGTINLKTKQLMKHRRSDMITKVVNIDYIENSFKGIFKKFINDICADDEALAEYLNRVYGYNITGETSEQCIFMEIEYGANGKSTLNELCKALMKDYAETVSYNLFSSDSKISSNSATPELAKLFNIRMVVCSEMSERPINEAKIKEITGGTELTARPLYKNPFKYMPQFKVIMETNTLPHISGFDYGIWRRIVVIPFKKTFKKNTSFKDKLMNEKEALLCWLVEGAYKFYAEGLGSCKAVEKASQKYRAAEDSVENFIGVKLKKSKGSEVKSKLLYDKYKDFCDVNETNVLDNKKFKEAMTIKGYKSKRKSSGIVWLDIIIDDKERSGFNE